MAHLVRVTLLTEPDSPLMQYEVLAGTGGVGWRLFERVCEVLKAHEAQERRQQEGRP